MSAQQTYVAAILLTVVAVVLVGMFLVLSGMLWWCLEHADDTQLFGKFMDRACGSGVIKEMALTLIGAVSAMWGAYQLRKA